MVGVGTSLAPFGGVVGLLTGDGTRALGLKVDIFEGHRPQVAAQ